MGDFIESWGASNLRLLPAPPGANMSVMGRIRCWKEPMGNGGLYLRQGGGELVL